MNAAFEPPAKLAIDATLGLGAVTSPWWIGPLHSINEVAATVAAVGGAIVMLVRLWLVLQDVARKRSPSRSISDGDDE